MAAHQQHLSPDFCTALTIAACWRYPPELQRYFITKGEIPPFQPIPDGVQCLSFRVTALTHRNCQSGAKITSRTATALLSKSSPLKHYISRSSMLAKSIAWLFESARWIYLERTRHGFLVMNKAPFSFQARKTGNEARALDKAGQRAPWRG